MKKSAAGYKRIVIKIGSSLLYSGKSGLENGFAGEITSQISALINDGNEIVLVSSGAIALGMSILKLHERPKDLAHLQAAAAIGQHELMDVYSRSFKQKGFNCAQLLLTWEDFDDRKRYLNAKNTLGALLKLNCVPVINENDTVSTDEIKFGDNDRLSALVSILVGADLLIILSDVDGLLNKEKKVIPVVSEINHEIKSLACPTDKKTCVGGMITKIEAARIAVNSGVPCVIACGRRKDIILSVMQEPEKFGTLFVPKKGLSARKHWIAFGTKPKGRIMVDDGAKKALINKKSLLSVGVLSASGAFESGDIVSVIDEESSEFARGKAGLSRRQLDKVKGSHSDKEVIHRDNIVIL